MRRGTTTFTFDRGIFAAWYAGGAIWLDDDDQGNTSAIHQYVLEVFGKWINRARS